MPSISAGGKKNSGRSDYGLSSLASSRLLAWVSQTWRDSAEAPSDLTVALRVPGAGMDCCPVSPRNKMTHRCTNEPTSKINSSVRATRLYCRLPNLLDSFAITFIISAHLMRPWS